MKIIILEKPYVSKFLIETIKKNDFKVIDNEVARIYFASQNLVSKNELKNASLVYSNSENSITLLNENEDIFRMIELSKDKAKFRQILKNIYPNYYFKKLSLKEIKNLNVNKLHFPLVLKPNTGFLSFGVYPIYDKADWTNVINNIDSDLKKFENVFPESVVDTSSFILEEMINGEEYAIDGFFNNSGEAVILNIFHHPFFDKNDVSDRLYYTSKQILKKYLQQFNDLLNKIAKTGNYKNFPFHLELRVDDEEKIIPIELNPMRFCGWCITDIAKYAWGINVYEYFFNQKKPDWEHILNKATDDYFYFAIAEVPQNTKKPINVDYQGFLLNISNPVDIRKIDFKTNPVFAIVFAKTNSLEEMKKILALDMKNYVIS